MTPDYNFKQMDLCGAHIGPAKQLSYSIEGDRVSRQAFIDYMERHGRHEDLAYWLEREQDYLKLGYTIAREPALC